MLYQHIFKSFDQISDIKRYWTEILQTKIEEDKCAMLRHIKAE